MIRFVENKLLITKKVKPEKGDTMCTFSTGIKDRESGKYIGRGRHLKIHDDSPSSKLSAICVGTEKVIWSKDFSWLSVIFTIRFVRDKNKQHGKNI